MPNPRLLSTALLALLAYGASAQEPVAEKPAGKAPAPSVQEILDASPAAHWRRPDPANTLYMDIEGGRVVIELAPRFAPHHVENIRTLAREGFWDGLSIYRSQDNFVVQFGDPDADDTAAARSLGSARTHLPAEFERSGEGLPFTVLPDVDGWAPQVGFVEGFPAGRDPQAGLAWMAHCYGALGAGRAMAADSSTGAELYVVTGQSPRQLDRNITLVGRVIEGIELLSVIPRGPEPMGFYEDPAQRTGIASIRLASEVPAAERSALEVLRTDSPTFARITEARRNRRDDWYKVSAGHIDLCNVPLPVREIDADGAADEPANG